MFNKKTKEVQLAELRLEEAKLRLEEAKRRAEEAESERLKEVELAKIKRSLKLAELEAQKDGQNKMLAVFIGLVVASYFIPEVETMFGRPLTCALAALIAYFYNKK